VNKRIRISVKTEIIKTHLRGFPGIHQRKSANRSSSSRSLRNSKESLELRVKEEMAIIEELKVEAIYMKRQQEHKKRQQEEEFVAKQLGRYAYG